MKAFRFCVFLRTIGVNGNDTSIILTFRLKHQDKRAFAYTNIHKLLNSKEKLADQ